MHVHGHSYCGNADIDPSSSPNSTGERLDSLNKLQTRITTSNKPGNITILHQPQIRLHNLLGYQIVGNPPSPTQSQELSFHVPQPTCPVGIFPAYPLNIPSLSPSPISPQSAVSTIPAPTTLTLTGLKSNARFLAIPCNPAK
jgi:hypothetical protein